MKEMLTNTNVFSAVKKNTDSDDLIGSSKV